MATGIRTVVAAACIALFCFLSPQGQAMNNALDARQQSVVAISAFTANGDIESLRTALNEGLDAGLTVTEIKEVLIQLYAYTGFPRSLNAIHAFMAVLDGRRAQGIIDEEGRESSPAPEGLDKNAHGAGVRAKLLGQDVIPPASGYQLFAPAIDTFLKEHLFADIFVRDALDFQTRELATISALAAMSGTTGQLRVHLGAAMNVGLSPDQMRGFVSVVDSRVGKEEAATAGAVLEEVLAARAASQ